MGGHGGRTRGEDDVRAIKLPAAEAGPLPGERGERREGGREDNGEWRARGQAVWRASRGGGWRVGEGWWRLTFLSTLTSMSRCKCDADPAPVRR
eukprot:CAMPEP_0181319278 /NCGR_PEP_ID=MMETSP1101-20121128/17481_1 /TAXON_ID=46948 /ORGANISM="Rhodomonas abbreviata, Strain Caron Lab Isolate" /LENGTH=93 /DNA_ID=CAMNT_0023426857 /DNA_START=217 /DNA_END=494 /DNA_ORIENTATION=-